VGYRGVKTFITFEEDVGGFGEHVDDGVADKDGKGDGADGVDDLPVGFEVDEDTRKGHADGLHEVGDDVEVGGFEVDVAVFFLLFGVFFLAAAF
jgi:hypothetical protein